MFPICADSHEQPLFRAGDVIDVDCVWQTVVGLPLTIALPLVDGACRPGGAHAVVSWNRQKSVDHAEPIDLFLRDAGFHGKPAVAGSHVQMSIPGRPSELIWPALLAGPLLELLPCPK